MSLDKQDTTRDRPLVAMECRAEVGSEESTLTVKLSPDGEVPSKSGTYLLDDAAAAAIVAEFASHKTDLVVDWEHQTVGGEFSAPDGRAPAAGWISTIWYEQGRGLLGSVRWNSDARESIRAGHYRYLSPVLLIRRTDKRAVALHSVGLTNKPAIPDMDRLAASARESQNTETGMSSIEEIKALIGELGKALEMEDGADSAAILKAAIEKLKKGDDDKGDGEEDAKVVSSVRDALGSDFADASASRLILGARLAIAGGGALADTQAQLAALKEAEVDDAVDRVVNKYASDPDPKLNRRDKATMQAARTVARENPEAFERMMQSAQPIYHSGRTTTPVRAGGSAHRVRVVHKAGREYTADDGLQKTTSLEAYANLALREAGLPRLSAEEVKTLA